MLVADPGVRAILDLLVVALPGGIGDDLIGLYLYGSAVSGGFDAGVSDIDLVAACGHGVDSLDLEGLDRVHRSVVERHPEWSDRLEIVYVDRAALAAPEADPAKVAVISPGEPFHVSGPVSDWLQNWYLLRETGVALIGPPAKDVVGPITHEAFIGAVVAYVEYLRARPYTDLGPGALAYSVLSMCRALATVRTGRSCTKQQAAAWVQGLMPQWVWVIDAALATRLSRGTTGFDDDRSRSGAIALIQLLADQVTVEARKGAKPLDM